jgi:hypothetical protein
LRPHEGKALFVLGDVVTLKLSAAETNSAYSLIEIMSAIGQGSLYHHAPIFLISFDTHTWRDQMNWFSVQMNVAIIAGVLSLNIGLTIVLVAAILSNRKIRQDFKLEFAAEGVARELLLDHNALSRISRLKVSSWRIH